MRKVLLALLLVGCSVVSYALHVECVGKAAVLTNGSDTLLVFEKEPYLKTKVSVGKVEWYRLPDTITPIQPSSDYLDTYIGLEHGGGYMIKKGDIRNIFWVFDYEQLRAQVEDITATPDCYSTLLDITGTIPTMQYTDLNGMTKTYRRECSVSYTSVQWDTESQTWLDSAAVETVAFANTINIGATPKATDIYVYDLLLDSLGIAGDSLRTAIDQPIAIKANPQAIVTTRGKTGDKSNEVERPTDPETLLKRSAPLIVNFRANALNAEYYDWRIRKGSEELVQRADAQHEYTFNEPGNYTVVLGMSNSYGCTMDTVTFDVAVSASMLLVPNVFTPNGDGTHDEFRVVYRSLKEFQIHVYNRLGHLVYTSTDPSKGWDGKINGKDAAAGAYYYVIRALGTDAEMEYISKPEYTRKMKKGELPLGVYQMSGDINLLR